MVSLKFDGMAVQGAKRGSRDDSVLVKRSAALEARDGSEVAGTQGLQMTETVPQVRLNPQNAILAHPKPQNGPF